LVFIKLFDVYESPAKELNRKIQEQFWKFFDLANVISKYKSENEIIESLENIIAKARKKRNNTSGKSTDVEANQLSKVL
jgi:hypothetical protein